MRYYLTITFVIISMSGLLAQWNTNGTSVYYDGGNVGVGTSTPGVWFGATPVLEMSSIRPVLKLTSQSSTGLSTLTFTNSFINGTTHNGEFHVNHQFDVTDNSKSLLRFNTYPGGEVLSLRSDGNVGIGTSTPQTKLDINAGAGDAIVGTSVIRVGGTNNYPSLELGIKGAYDGQISTYGNDLHIYAGNWRVAGAFATENHNISFYTSQMSSNNWNTPKMVLRYDGNLGIGTTSPQNKLDVNGTIHSKEVKVDLTGWPDYVFAKDYEPTSLEDLKSYIEANQHLPEMPSAKQVESEGLQLGEMNKLLLKKVEEMTLYIIDQNEVNQEQALVIQKLENRLKQLEDKIN